MTLGRVPPGNVLYLNMLGQDIIVLGSLNAARDLLDKRSANYSDRPKSVMVQLCVYLPHLSVVNVVLTCCPLGPNTTRSRP